MSKQISSLTHIGYIKNFIPSRLDAGFRRWTDFGLTIIHQLCDKDSFKSFEQLKFSFSLPNSDFFRFLQLRDFLTKHKEWNKVIKPTPIEDLLLTFMMDENRKVIKEFYQTFLDMTPNNT